MTKKLKKDIIGETLNSLEALTKMEPKPLGHNTAKDVLLELASFLDSNYERCHEWIVQRRCRPHASTVLEMMRWNNQIVEALNQSEKVSYGKAFRVIIKNRK